MSEYLENLGKQATAGDVFYDLYAQTEAVVAELEGLREASYGHDTSLKPVPGTALEMDWSAVADENDGCYRSTTVSAVYFGERSSLNAITRHQQRQNITTVPAAVRGYRATELLGDYTIADRETGLIELNLRRMGRRRVNTDEPVGASLLPTDQKINKLIGEERHRLVIVTQGILDNLTAIELILEGQNPQEVLAAMEKDIVRY